MSKSKKDEVKKPVIPNDPPEIAGQPPVDSIEVTAPGAELPLTDDEPKLEQIAGEMPHVEEEAVAAAQEKENITQAPPVIDKVDRLGRKFDPVIHSINPDGTPRITVDGFLAQKRGNKAKIIMPERQATGQSVAPDAAALKEAVNRRYTAEVAAGLYIQTGVAIFGDEWQPEKSKEMDERQNLVNATDDYFKMVGFTELPPWAGLAVAYGSYGLRRFNRPVTKTKLQKAGDWCRNKIVKFYNWRLSRKKKKPATVEPDKINVEVEVKESEGGK